MIKLENVNKYYETGGERVHAVRNLSVTFPDTGLVFIVGPSGSGKSTLLNILGGLDKPDEGEIYIEDKPLSKFTSRDHTNYLNSYLGFVFQEYNILKDLTLKENICLPLEIQGYKRKDIKRKFAEIIEAVELKGLEKRKVTELSGGQKQRIAIARALIKEPKLIIADEPTGNLDSETSNNIFKIFKKLSKDRLVIIVTHDEESAFAYGDMLVRISPDGDSLHEVINQNNELEKDIKPLVLKKARVPLKTCLKLSLKNMWKKKVRYFIVFLICAISLAFLSFTIELNVTNKEDIVRQNVYTMIENGYRFTEIYQGVAASDEEIEKDVYQNYAYVNDLSTTAYEDLKDVIDEVTLHSYAKVSICYAPFNTSETNSFYTGYINTLIKYDETNEYDLVAGRLPNSGTKEILVTDYLIEAFKFFNLYPECQTIYDFLNLQISLAAEDNYKIVGIIKTDYEKWTEFQNIADGDIDYSINKDKLAYQNDFLFFNSVIINEEYFNIEKNSTNKMIGMNNEEAKSFNYIGSWSMTTPGEELTDISVKSSLGLTYEQVNVAEFTYTGHDYEGNEYTETYTFGRNPVQTTDGVEEIVLPISLITSSAFPNTGKKEWWESDFSFAYSSIKFNDDGTLNEDKAYIVQRAYSYYKSYVEGKTITLTISNFDSENPVTYTKQYKVVGAYFTEQNTISTKLNYFGVVTTSEYNNIYSMFTTDKPNVLMELPNSREKALTIFNEAYNIGYVVNVWVYKDDISGYEVDPFIDLASKAGLFIFAAFTMGIIWTIVSIEIVDSKKEIGILRSIGLSGEKVSLIFVVQTTSMIFLSYFLGVFLGYKLIPIYNSQIKDELNQIILYIYSFTYRTPLYLGIFVIAMILISAFIPLGKIMSHKIIDVINERDN